MCLLDVVFESTGQATIEQSEIQTYVPCGRIFPAQHRIGHFWYVVSRSKISRSEVIRTRIQSTQCLIRIYSLIGSLTITYTQFQYIQPLYTIHKGFVTDIPTGRYSRISMPLMTFCQTWRSIRTNRCHQHITIIISVHRTPHPWH